MTDPNLPPERVVVVDPPRQTTVNVQPERSGGGGAMAFIIGGLLVVVAVIAFLVWNGGSNPVDKVADTNVDVDVNLPDPPKMPDLPNVEPPTLPSPGPQPAN